MVTIRGVAVLACAALAACARPAPPPAIGRRLADGAVAALRASADGQALAFLRRCEPVRDRTLPPGTAGCELAVVPAAGGDARGVARGVTTLPVGFAWAGAGHALAALADYDHAEGWGTLVLWTGGAPRTLAARVAFYALDGAGDRVGWVAGGQLHLADVRGGAGQAVAGASAVATLEFGAGRRGLLARRSSRAGGELLAVQGGAVRTVAAGVRDYGFAGDGERFAFTAGAEQALAVAAVADARPGAALGRGVHGFVFSPRGDAIAFVADAAPGRQGDLWVAAGGGAPVRLGRRVGEPRWSKGGGRLAWLEDYDPRSRTGVLTLGAASEKPAAVARNVSDFDLTADGAAVAYLVHETAGGYSVDLGLARPGAAPVKVARGVFGFSFSPDGAWLYYRTACVREAEACELERVPVRAPAGAPPERIAQGVKSYEFAPGRPGRLLLGWARKDRVALDLAVWEGGKLTAVDSSALPGSAGFTGGDATRLHWAVNDPTRAGVYVADLP